jgi:hypothetical protein
MRMYPDAAIVLLVSSPGVHRFRFYRGISPSKRLETAWSLAGAKLFGRWDIEGIEKAEKEVRKRKRACRRATIRVNWEELAHDV